MPRLLHLFIIFLLYANIQAANKPAQAPSRFVGVNVDSLIIAITNEATTAQICGIWQATTDGATVGIVPAKLWKKATSIEIPHKEPTLADEWVIILLDSPDPFLQPGTLMGWLSPAAKPNYYNAVIYTKRKYQQLAKPQNFTLQLIDDSHLSMRAIRHGLEISPWRLLPYMLRRAVRYIDERPRDLDGFLRKWPASRRPLSPKFL